MVLDETLSVDKFDDADFKYGLVFWNSSPKYPITAILVPNLKIFVFGPNFVFGKVWKCWWKISQYCSFFDFQPKNTQIRQIWFYLKNVFLQEIINFDKLNGKVKHDNSFF